MEIEGVESGLVTCPVVYGLEESLVASGFPMLAEYDGDSFKSGVDAIRCGGCQMHSGRAQKLAGCPMGTGHDNFMCGIVVQFNLTAPRYLWHEVQRYHFMDIVSCTSTMHMLMKTLEKCMISGDHDVVLDRLCGRMSKSMPREVMDGFYAYAKSVMESRSLDDRDKLLKLKLALPEGWMQTGRITTNYRQLKTVYAQRRNHRLPEWREFCGWIETLPMSRLMVQK